MMSNFWGRLLLRLCCVLCSPRISLYVYMYVDVSTPPLGLHMPIAPPSMMRVVLP
jgi:hypothetical protein